MWRGSQVHAGPVKRGRIMLLAVGLNEYGAFGSRAGRMLGAGISNRVLFFFHRLRRAHEDAEKEIAGPPPAALREEFAEKPVAYLRKHKDVRRFAPPLGTTRLKLLPGKRGIVAGPVLDIVQGNGCLHILEVAIPILHAQLQPFARFYDVFFH